MTTRFVREEEGQDLIEYTLLAALLVVASVVSLGLLADENEGVLRRLIAAIAAA